MKNKLLSLVIAALFIFGLLITAQPVSAHFNATEVNGTIKAIDTGASTLTITPKKGGPDVVLKVDSTTMISRLYKTATLADLQPGDRVMAYYDASTMLASFIYATPNMTWLSGVIKAIDTGASTLTITPKKGGPDVVLTVDSTTMIKRLGHSATLADLQLGDRVDAFYNATTFLAVKIWAQLNLVELNGTISAIDTGAGTVSVTPKKGGVDVVLKVDTTTVIKRSGHPATLADLQLGDRVEAKYNPVTFLAAKIWAQPHLDYLNGTISAIDTGAGTVSVTPKKGGPDVALKVDSTTVIKRNWKPATLADLQLGDRIEAKYNAVTFLATWINAKPHLVEVHGLISGVDSGAGTVSVTPKKGGPDIVLKVDSTTMIKRNHAPATLTDLQVGDAIDARYNPITMLAAWIDAHTYLVEVDGKISIVDTGANTVTVTPEKGGPDVVLKVDSNTIIKSDKNKLTLADLKVGDEVEAKYSPTTMLAVMIEIENESDHQD